jgi:hypothetical protein
MAKVFVSDSMGMADVMVAVVRDRGRADLLVCRVDTYGAAGGAGLWFMTLSRQSANLTVFFCSEGMARLKICFVPTRGEAGWVNGDPHPLRRRLTRL